jgi:hypothetical protein
MGLVDDEGIVIIEPAVGLCLGQKHTVGQDLDEGVPRRLVVKADLVPDRAAEGLTKFLGDAMGDGDGGDPPGLGASHFAADAPTGFEAHLRDLGALAASCFARDNDDLVFLDRPDDFGSLGRDRKLGWIVESGHVAKPHLLFLG